MKKASFLAALLGLAAVLPAADNGMVAVGRTAGAVTIDGNLDEASWRTGVTLTPFILQKQNVPATEQTEAKFLWDDDNLYLAFRCYERALDPVENRLHDFKADVKENDSPRMSSDDRVILILTRGAKSFDFAFNANGAVLDASGRTADIWPTRDLKWNSGAKAAALCSNASRTACYQVEIAIPWSALGGAPVPGDDWRFAVGRHEKSARENSAWQIVSAGLHSSDSLSRMKFLKATVPGLKPQGFPQFAAGDNPWRFANDSGKAVRIDASVQFEKQPVRRFQVSGAAPELTLPLTVEGNGSFLFRYHAENPASFTRFVQSPLYRFQVSASMLSHNFRQAGLLVNGKPGTGKSMLKSGLNTITLEGTPADDEIVTVGKEQYRLAAGETLRLLLNDSAMWPDWTGEGVAVNAGSIQQLLFFPRGVKGFTLKDYTIHFDVPDGFEIVGASGYYERTPLAFSKDGAVTVNGRPLTRYSIRLAGSVPFAPKQRQHQMIAVLLRAAENAAGQSDTVYFHVSSAEKNIRELPNPLTVKVLPALAGKQPKKYIIRLSPGFLRVLSDRSLYRFYHDLFQAAGVNDCPAFQGRYPDIRHGGGIGFAEWNFPLTPYLAEHPDRKRVNPEYPLKSPMVCSTAMVREPDFAAFFRAALKPWHERHSRPQNISWDHESEVLSGELSCFCPRCLADFQKAAGLSERPTFESIKTNYLKEWTHYMDQRMADVSKLFYDAIHAELPGVRYSVYSGYQSEKTKSHYGVDWAMLAGALDYAVCGYGRNEAELEATRRALGSTPLCIGELVYPWDIEPTAPQYVKKAVLMRRACDATAGIFIYKYPTLDGRTFDSLAAVSRVVADYEEFFLRGDRVNDALDLRGFDRADYEVLRDAQGGLLIVLLNPTGKPRRFTFSLKQPAAGGLLEVATGRRLTEKEVPGVIEPFGFAVYTTK